ncbi:MAG: peptide deformylase [Chitinophagales bacterium]|nr:peptide deformylase [Chitinophagales bacterium]MDW8272895.1 peptide deformylase [Chitinophagales bacterium]
MILPIVAYGDPVLRKKCTEIDEQFSGLQELIDNMFETMEHARGVGLAAPQINMPIRLFVIDSTQMNDENDQPNPEGLREVFINPNIIEETGEEWVFEEGCLSIPGIRENIVRLDTVKIQYYDRDFKFKENTFKGLTARVIQHEYDHIEGKLFIDYLKPLKRSLLKGKLENISKGKVEVSYKMRFPKK